MGKSLLLCSYDSFGTHVWDCMVPFWVWDPLPCLNPKPLGTAPTSGGAIETGYKLLHRESKICKERRQLTHGKCEEERQELKLKNSSKKMRNGWENDLSSDPNYISNIRFSFLLHNLTNEQNNDSCSLWQVQTRKCSTKFPNNWTQTSQ
jgi:hypothetical protein